MTRDLPTEITLLLRPGIPLPALHHSAAAGQRVILTHAELADRHAARPDDVELVQSFAHQHHLKIAEVDAGRRTVRLTGTPSAIAHAFSTALHPSVHPTGNNDGSSISALAARGVPPSLRDAVEAVLGLGTGRAARRRTEAAGCPATEPHTVRQLASAYEFPEGLDGTGQTIGLIELGGGFHMEDIKSFCDANGIPTPRISIVEVHGGRNAPAPTAALHRMLDCVNGKIKLSAAQLQSPSIEAAQATAEVTMDLALAAGLAPGAHLVVYFGTPDEQGIYHALSRAIHDESHRPDVLSISWGEPEPAISEHYMHAIDRLLQIAAHLAITVCASSGDAGALNHSPDKLPAVNFPASSPHCLACGGTTAHFHSTAGSVEIVDEVVWNANHFGFNGATGGGVSRSFALPAWQQRAKVPLGPTGKSGRGVPDVAGPADPRYGCEIRIAGRHFASAGTSAVAPLWAALLARCNQGLGRRCGHIHEHLYSIGEHHLAGLRQVPSGDNDGYQAGPGWNPCAGYGTPSGKHLYQYLRRVLKENHREAAK